MSAFRFEILHTSKKSSARAGRIHTPHGTIDTPNFVAVGTLGTLKAIENTLADEMGLELMFCNTYHLMLHPGADVVEKAGGLHPFTSRKGPIITDSGGFQVFSLAYGSVADELKSKGQKKGKNSVLKITEEGVIFRSYRDGKRIDLTPESSIQAQKSLGADIIIPLDELPPYHIGEKELRDSFERTHRWEKRSLDEHLKNPNNQAIYSVIHGGTSISMRLESAQRLGAMDFDGHAIGGSFGKTKEQMLTFLEALVPKLPPEKPMHLLGIGDLASVAAGTKLGIDTFDSSYPTRAARHGILFTDEGNLKISNTKFSTNFGPIEKGCTCPTCKHYSLGYIHHLFKSKELSGQRLMSIHNLSYMIRFMKKMREQILHDEI